jgi:hypothetical protein
MRLFSRDPEGGCVRAWDSPDFRWGDRAAQKELVHGGPGVAQV